MDKVLFSKGLAWVKLSRFTCDAEEAGYGPSDPEAGGWRFDGAKLRNGVAALERCITLCPSSPLADDALRAVVYWRRECPDAFE
jgi:hypothetical protein